MINCIDALIRNRNIHLELHLDQLLPRIITCIVAKQIGSTGEIHWLLRDEALRKIREPQRGGDSTLCVALDLNANQNQLGMFYIGNVGIKVWSENS